MAEDRPIRVFLTDDHAVFRESLACHLAQYPNIEIVGEAPHAKACVEKLEGCRPDVILMDINMPGLNPFAAVSLLTSHDSSVRVLFLSALCSDVLIKQAIDARAWGYVTKSQSTTMVHEAICSVHAGRPYYSPEIRSRLVHDARGVHLAEGACMKACLLTARQIELLGYLAQGKSTHDIADLMCISCKTVENHKSNLMNRLGIHDRVELARFAIREGLASA
jgi:DNA-binding NarL/FixJ family response regulator